VAARDGRRLSDRWAPAVLERHPVRTAEHRGRSRDGTVRAVAQRWTFLTNHGRVLLTLAKDPDIRLREVADRVGITERAAQMIVADLVAAGYITKQRVGRRNHYSLDHRKRFRHPHESEHQVGELLEIFAGR
jgi:hypothetical protein